MKAAQLVAYGGQGSVKVTNDAVKPTIMPDQVLIKVHAAALNPFDYKVREGFVRRMAELHFPATLGGDVAGVIEEVGEQIDGFTVGDAVYGQAGALSGNGSFAEYSPIAAKSIAKKPESVDFDTAAALPLVSASAYQAIYEHIHLRPDQKILIHGGGGGIGSTAIQLAKHIGAYVATTVSSDDIEYVRSIGADRAIDYKNEDFTDSIKDYDAVFDTVGGEPNTKSYEVLKPGGIFVSMIGQKDEQLANEHHIEYISESSHVTTEKLEAIAKLVDTNVLRVRTAKTYPLDQVPEALEFLKTGHPHGKVVIQVVT